MFNKTENQPQAKTQMFFIKDDDKKVLQAILENENSNISFSFISITKELNKAERYKKMHRDIKKAIKHFSETNNVGQYETIRIKDTCYFFYISNKTHKPSDIIESIINSNIDLKRAISSLFSLAMKNKTISKASDEYDIPPAFYNDKIYIGTQLQDNSKDSKGRLKIDTFEPEIFYSDESNLSFHLKNKTFKAELSNLNLIESDNLNNIMFKTKTGAFTTSEEEIDAVRYNKSKFMKYKSYYPECQNYSFHFLHKIFIELLNELEIAYEEVYFKANYIVKDFLYMDTAIKRDIILLDNYQYNEEELPYKKELMKQIYNYLGVSKVEQVDENYLLGNLKKDFNYLCINKENRDSKSSIFYKDNKKGPNTYLNTFSKANNMYLKEKTIDFDFYTQLKLLNKYSDEKLVTQGLNIPSIKQKEKNQNGSLYKELNENKLKKIKKEIWLKECIFHYNKIENIELIDGKYTLFFTKNNFTGKKEKQTRISVVNIEIFDKTLFIIDSKIYDNINRFNLDFSKNVISKMKLSNYSGSFYIYDKENEILLTSYTSKNVPRIIGNSKFNNIDHFVEYDDLKKTNKADISPLPYYLTPKKEKQSNFVFIQETEDKLYYFVSQKGNPNSSFDKQKLIYSVLTYDNNKNKIKQIEQKVTDLFLSSFTDDILLNNEVSKSSILEKIAKEFLFE